MAMEFGGVLIGAVVSMLSSGLIAGLLIYPVVKRFLGKEWPDFLLSFERAESKLHTLELDLAKVNAKLDHVEYRLNRIEATR